MKTGIPLCAIILVLLSLSSTATACLWDTDTLAAEQARFPQIAQLITGLFPRHSREFHEWRCKRSEELIRSKKDKLSTYDDLAVSQHKLGDHKAAIQTMLKKEGIFPGVYETYSNLGTFYIYTGELDQAKKHISRALQINPKAHFGREKFQLWLVEWIQDQKDTDDEDIWLGGYARFVALKMRGRDLANPGTLEVQLTDSQRAEALRGVWGMMWFADFDNPILLEALGDLLVAGHPKENGAILAALSFTHAHRKTADPKVQARLRKKISESLAMQVQYQDKPDEASKDINAKLDAGIAKSKAYAESVRADEIAWIQAGNDVGLEFQKKYLPPEK